MARIWSMTIAGLVACGSDAPSSELGSGSERQTLDAQLWDEVGECWGPVQSLDWTPNLEQCRDEPTLAEFYDCYRFTTTCTPAEDVWAIGCHSTPEARLDAPDCQG